MKEIIEQILPSWGIEHKHLLQIYPSVWEVNHSNVIKIYNDKNQLERNIKILTILSDCNIPVAEIVLAKTGEKYVAHENAYFLMSKKLQGSNISDIRAEATAHKMGCAFWKFPVL